ncbi:MAG: hypothetical protein FJ126_03785 [Deltaproteobacteria bacterium]|nr:hypothetical protein [Deltaproteobacteria bacterium]
MTIRYLAQELYRLTKQVEELEKSLAALDLVTSVAVRARLEGELVQVRKELERVREVLEAKKEKPLI